MPSLANEELQRLPVDSGEGRKLDYVNPALPGLTLANEGLGPPEPPGDLSLGQPRLLPRLSEADQKPGVSFLVLSQPPALQM